jgi:GNAT superfamily N-acetyltransferase
VRQTSLPPIRPRFRFAGRQEANMKEMHFKLLAALDGVQQEAIHIQLREFNRAGNAAFFHARDLPENAPRPLNVVVCDAAGTIVGGLIAETEFQWLKISIMAVAQHLRRRGIGRQLVALAEQEAKARGCRHAYLDTMDYQAPNFYRQLGYQLVGTLENWDSHGHAKLFFTKELA